jgi:hypothetical protein
MQLLAVPTAECTAGYAALCSSFRLQPAHGVILDGDVHCSSGMHAEVGVKGRTGVYLASASVIGGPLTFLTH